MQPLHSSPDPKLDYLDDGEREAIALAEELQADDILVDELLARKEAARRRLRFIRTLGILRRAAQLDSNLSFLGARLEQTTSYLGSDLIRSLLDDDAQRRNL